MRRDDERLADIVEAATKIRSRVEGGRARFDADEDVQIVLVHLVQIIGEASSRVSSEIIGRYPDVPWRQIVGMRNRVIHDYFDVDLDILWFVVTVDVPRLAERISEIISDLDEPTP